MTTTDYLITAAFVLIVLSLARERRLDLQSFLVPLVILVLVRSASDSFRASRRIDAAAWPVALVLLAIVGVAARVVIVQVRGRRLADPYGHARGQRSRVRLLSIADRFGPTRRGAPLPSGVVPG